MLVKTSLPMTGAVCERPRLFRLLERARKQAPLVWIQGSAGSGKTTLVTSFLRKRKVPRLWYSMDAGDVDLATLFHQLAMAAPKGRSATPPLPTQERILGIDVFSREFFEKLGLRLPEHAVLVLDNLQDARLKEASFEALLRGFRSLRKGQTVFVLSREPPPPAAASAEVSGALLRIQEADLCLTEEEVTEVVRLRKRQARGKANDAAHCRALWQRTRGWGAFKPWLCCSSRWKQEHKGQTIGFHVIPPSKSPPALHAVASLALLTLPIAYSFSIWLEESTRYQIWP